VWPRNAIRDDSGEVTLAGVPVCELAREYGTPLFVVDEKDFRSRCADMIGAFGQYGRVHYASKAFLSTEIARWVNEEGLCLDVCSGGELAVAHALRAQARDKGAAVHPRHHEVDQQEVE
jgi:diaminopimelate decarboxylase